MDARNPHQALKHDTLGNFRSEIADFVLVRSHWGKDDAQVSLHVSPHVERSGGTQVTDFLSLLGFTRMSCPFFNRRECCVRWVNDESVLQSFARSVSLAYQKFIEAERHLNECGFFLDRHEGPFCKRFEMVEGDFSSYTDGHTSASSEKMKCAEDNSFIFKFVWLINDVHRKGWVIHYAPKHAPFSSEVENVLQFLGLQAFQQCPEFDFAPCRWRSIAYREGPSFDGNTGTAYYWFDAHAEHFSVGIENLLDAHVTIEKVGLSFLQFSNPETKFDRDIEKRTARPKAGGTSGKNFDIAISFARSERQLAEELATLLRDDGISVFYDNFYQEELWGKNLVEFFDNIYRKRARYCVMFISTGYRDSIWTNQERQSAQARALQEKGKEYILPVIVEDVELPGMIPTLGNVGIDMGINAIAELLKQKLRKQK